MLSTAEEPHVPGGSCWDASPWPDRALLDHLKAGPVAEAWAEGPSVFRSVVKRWRREHVERPAIFVGTGTCGLGAGAAKTLAAIRAYIEARRVAADVIEVGCVGLCSDEPLVDVRLPGHTRLAFCGVTANKVPALLDKVLASELPEEGVLGQYRPEHGESHAWADAPYLDQHPFLVQQRRVVLANSGLIDPGDIDEHIAHGGYSAFAKALRSLTPEEVCDLVEKSGLRGRGGAGFPTGKKWKFARASVADQKFLICNADEGDPGAFMDRAVGESDPHRLIEGIAIAAYAIGATRAYIYIRAEYPVAVARLRAAIKQATAYGLLGDNILDSGYDLNVRIKMGAGAFVCGEETALIHSIEGRRGMPRPRPPFPVARGLFGLPTVINNVETLANLPLIVDRGASWYAGMGTAGSKGTKVFALSGMVRRTGLVEIPMGTTLRQIVFDIGGGIPGGRRCKAVQIGGPSGGCVPEAHLDLPTDYEALKSFGTIMGSGGLVVVDETTCMVDFAKFFMEFIQSESCGKCIPCREGTRRMLEILQAICRPRRKEDPLDALVRFQGMMYLKELGETIRSTSLCGLGQTASNPVLSTLEWFRDEYEAHIYERRCPAGACKDLVGAPCQHSCPVGTEVWRYVANIAQGDYEEAYRVIREANPFPSVCARVCHHPCEKGCRAGATGGEPIAVRSLKRFVVDHVSPDVYHDEVRPTRDGARVAVVGAGPAGLTAAYCLGRMGHRVTVFERESRPGGMLVSAIPAYRLPRETLQKEIEHLLLPTVELRCNQALGRDFEIDELMNGQGYRAVFLAVGAHRSKPLGIPGEDACAGVIPSIRFLKAHNLHGEALAAGRVGIVGGGNSAVDAARVALRQRGVSEVVIYYRRTKAEMPAYREEIEAAEAEGIRIEPLAAPVAVLSCEGRVTGIRLGRCRLGAPDASGRRQPIPIPGDEFTVELDTLIVAIGEQPETDGFDRINRRKHGAIVVNPESLTTSQPGVFAGGDVATGPNTVIDAIAAGKQAAQMIHHYVTDRLLKTLPHVTLPGVYIEPVESEGTEGEPAARVRVPELPVDQRRQGFAEVELCIAEGDARREARRCLRCDLEFTRPD